ncbi:tonB-system energizer ExbB [Jiella sp. KSK16Y-1]|uniref:Biopolymer transport protein ExbB n=2 Tax=Jiella mangrovi TaxID=2821407 RepID=A0ABS4BG42_9HYPH|nr:tonB-system energizer ExbB [Jiella mangrovi]
MAWSQETGAAQPIAPAAGSQAPEQPSATQEGATASGEAREPDTDSQPADAADTSGASQPESESSATGKAGAGQPPAEDPAAAENASAEAVAAVPFVEPRDEKLPHDLSPLGMFLAADWVVKGVMIGLALASLATWTILLVKGFEVFSAKWRARAGVKRLARADSLDAAIGDDKSAARWRGPVGALARSAAHEWHRSGELSAEGIKERVAIALARIEANAARSLNRGTGVLATIGSIAPFVGLFGTVWGIMNSFIGISEANTTNLAVVAPGIAEALLATAIGLVAAIPAVVVYNVFARSIAGYRAIVSDGSALVMQHLSRDIERSEAIGQRARLAEAAE